MTRDEARNRVFAVAGKFKTEGDFLVDALIALDLLRVEKEYTTLDLAREALKVQRFETVDRGAAMLSDTGIDLVFRSLQCMGLKIEKADPK